MNSIPWIEKYRPDNIDDIELDESIRSQLKTYNLESFPNLLITGLPGTGKTSTALILAKRLLTNMESCIELNASDNRGITMINDLTSNFVRKKFTDDNKIIILDEADNITKKAQQQLINMMENYPKLRFIMTCNSVNNIIEALQARCNILSFNRLSTEDLSQRLAKILEKEEVNYEMEAIRLLIDLSDHDIRCCLNYLQVLSKDSLERSDKITMKSVEDSFRVPSLSLIKDLLGENEINAILEKYYTMLESGFCSDDIIQMLICFFKRELDYVDNTQRLQIMNIINHIYSTHFMIVQTNDSELLVISMFYQLSEHMKSLTPSQCLVQEEDNCYKYSTI